VGNEAKHDSSKTSRQLLVSEQLTRPQNPASYMMEKKKKKRKKKKKKKIMMMMMRVM